MVYSKQKFHPGSLDLRRVAWWKLSLQKYTFFNIQTFFDNYFFNRQRLSCRPAIAPFRLASLFYRKQHALPTITALTKKSGVDGPNGTSDPQGHGRTIHRDIASSPFAVNGSTTAVLPPIRAGTPWRRGQQSDIFPKD